MRKPSAEFLRKPFPFGADLVDELGIARELLLYGDSPRFRIGLRIVHGDFDVEVPEIWPADPFADLRGLGNDAPVPIEIDRSSRNPTESISNVSPDHLADE